MADDDGTVLQRTQRGDLAAAGVLVDRHGPLVQLVAELLVGGGNAADVAVERAWSEAGRQLGGFDDERALIGCLLGVVVQRRTAGPLAPPEPDLGPFYDWDDEYQEEHRWKGAWEDGAIRCWSALGEDDAAPDGVNDVVLATLAALPSEPKAAIVLRDIADLSLDDTGWLLDVSTDDATEYVRWGRRAVRARLDKHLAPARRDG